MRAGEPKHVAAAFSTAVVPGAHSAQQTDDAVGREDQFRQEKGPWRRLLLSCWCLLAQQITIERTMTTHLPNPSCQAAGQSFCFAFSECEQSVLERAFRIKEKGGQAAFVPNLLHFLHNVTARL